MGKEEMKDAIRKELEEIKRKHGKEDHGEGHSRRSKRLEHDHEGKGKYAEGGRHMGGFFFIAKRSIWLAAGGALGALAAIGIGKVSQKVRPAVVGAVKEGYAFKEWAASKIERVREDAEDIVAEAKHAYHKDIETTAEAVRREKEILEKTEKAVEKKRARKKEAK